MEEGGCKEDSQMCNGMKKAATGFFFPFLFCHCSGAGSIYHPELIAHERAASRGDAAPAAITIRNRSTSASRGRRAAAQRGQDLPKGWKSLSLPACSYPLCLWMVGRGGEGRGVFEIFWQELKIPAHDEPPGGVPLNGGVRISTPETEIISWR